MDDVLLALQKAAELSPNNPEIYNQLGIIYYKRDDHDQALTNYLRAVELKPDYAEAHYNLALLFIKQGKIEAAVIQLTKVIALIPDKLSAHKLLADLHLQQSSFTDAIKHYQIILNLDPNHKDALNNLGVAYLKLNNPEKAIHYFTQVLALDEHHVDARNNLAATYLQADRYMNARNHYQILLKDDSESSEAHYNLGVCYMAVGELDDAHKEFTWVLSRNPNNIDSAVNLAAVSLKLNDVATAIKHYQHVLKLDPNQPVATYMVHALTHDVIPDAAPESYIQNLFDNYAGYYDKHVTEVLRYQVPKLMYDHIMALNEKPKMPWRILDLGCGTGLAGMVFKDAARYLYGIDLSEKMLTYAKHKNIYHHLQQGDIATGLDDLNKRLEDKFDLIIASDVFVYVGQLKTIFSFCAKLLANEGVFVFSVEELDRHEDFILQTSGRYAHSQAYIEKLIQANPFQSLFFKKVILRYQENLPVHGFLVAVKKALT